MLIDDEDDEEVPDKLVCDEEDDALFLSQVSLVQSSLPFLLFHLLLALQSDLLQAPPHKQSSSWLRSTVRRASAWPSSVER